MEVLVVIFILGLFIALLLPAVQAARRAHCQNNLHQLGVALHSYESSTGVIPSPFANAYAFHGRLLPYLDQTNLFNAINFEISSGSTQNTTARSTVLSVFLCPSDFGLGTGLPCNSYAGDMGSGEQRFGRNGVFAPIVATRDVTDGASHPAAVAEIVVGLTQSKNSEGWIFSTPEMLKPSDLDRFAATCRDLTKATSPTADTARGSGWIEGDYLSTLFNHVLKPNENSCTNGFLQPDGAWSAGSRHPGGVQVLMLDGHVKFLKDTISVKTWRALRSRDGGEIVPMDDSANW